VRRFWLVLLIAAVTAQAEPPPVVVRDPQAPAVRELVDLESLDAGFRFDLRYATPNNFVHATLYPVAKAYLARDAAKALVEVQQELTKEGLGLKIFDAYRPLSVQQRMWDLIHDDRYVSNPAINRGRHTRGTAVDLTLVDKDGNELPMPTPFDDFTERAHRGAAGIPEDAARNSKKLEEVMLKHGFFPYPFEWWHFDFRDWKKHPPLDVPLEELK
jgi:D-alanyl-D-alanine dipeptidase